MSNALVTVTFKDGLKLYTQYQGSSDSFYNALFDSPEEAWSHSRHTPEGSAALNRREPMKNPEAVQVYCGYGGGSDWGEHLACRVTKQLDIKYPKNWFGEEDWIL